MNKEENKTLKFNEEDITLKVSQYKNNGRIAILAFVGGEPYSNVTINLSGMCLDEDEGAIDSLTKSCGLEKVLIKKGIIKEVYGTASYNMGKYDIVAFDIEKLREYDPEGVKEFEKFSEQEDYEETDEEEM